MIGVYNDTLTLRGEIRQNAPPHLDRIPQRLTRMKARARSAPLRHIVFVAGHPRLPPRKRARRVPYRLTIKMSLFSDENSTWRSPQDSGLATTAVALRSRCPRLIRRYESSFPQNTFTIALPIGSWAESLRISTPRRARKAALFLEKITQSDLRRCTGDLPLASTLSFEISPSAGIGATQSRIGSPLTGSRAKNTEDSADFRFMGIAFGPRKPSP